tara:strand:+ start:11545 stop:12432 length:888 start_codon:yes stop_codon:yes gene_type:complete
MSKKVIVIPDLHLGKKFNITYGDSLIWENHALLLCKSIIQEEKPNSLLFLGDVFNTAHPSFHTIFTFLEVIKDIPTTIISGNHDIPKTLQVSIMDYLTKYVNIIPRNAVDHVFDNNHAIGWCDTQSMFSAKLETTLEHQTGPYLFLHAAYNNWDNEMDNVITNDLIKFAIKQNITMISGHEHVSNIRDGLWHIGSIMPMNIGELGLKYYWSSIDGLKEINHKVGDNLTNDIILTRKQIEPMGNKPITIRNAKVAKEDFIMEEKHLDLDIMIDLKEQAIKKGFSEEFLKTVGLSDE